MGKSNVEDKYVTVLFLPCLPVGLRGELGSSEVNAELGHSPRDLLRCRISLVHGAVSPLSPRDKPFLPLPVMCHVACMSHRSEVGGDEASSLVHGLLVLYARNSAGAPVVARGTRVILGQFLIKPCLPVVSERVTLLVALLRHHSLRLTQTHAAISQRRRSSTTNVKL